MSCVVSSSGQRRRLRLGVQYLVINTSSTGRRSKLIDCCSSSAASTSWHFTIPIHKMIFSTSIRKEELPPSGIVSRTTAEKERDIQRYAERKHPEENIRCLEARLKEQGALKPEARRRRLENELARAKLDNMEWQDDDEQQQEEGHVHPNKGQILIPSFITIPSGDEGSGPSISPLSSPMTKKGSSGKHNVQTHHVVSPSTVSTAAMSKHESSFEDDSSGEIIGGSSHCSPGNDASNGHQKFQQEAKNPRENSFQRSKKRFARLKRRVENLTNDADEYAKQNEHWQEKAIELTMKFYVLEEEMDKKVDGIDNLIRCEQLERLEKEVDELMYCAAKESTAIPDDEFWEEEARLAHVSLEEETPEEEYEGERDKKRFAKLKRRVENLTNDADIYDKQNEYWQERAIELTMRFYEFEEEMDKKVDGIDNLIRYKQLQHEKIDSLEKEVNELMYCAVLNDNILSDEAFREEESRGANVSLGDEALEEEYEGKQDLITETIGKIQQQNDQQSSLKLAKLKGLEEFIYQFSCGECRKARYVISAATMESLKKTALEIIEQSARVAVANTKQKAGVLDASSTEQQFVQHLASHVPTTAANSEADALLYCKRIIKAEKLKRRN
eukprot:scaffold6776_cov99-Skeletonema_dohrnii-CCMP3373.AAC.14